MITLATSRKRKSEAVTRSPRACPEAAEHRSPASASVCGKKFSVAGVEHVCASRAEHQPQRIHICLCGARRIED
jgi:hypothetical protein